MRKLLSLLLSGGLLVGLAPSAFAAAPPVSQKAVSTVTGVYRMERDVMAATYSLQANRSTLVIDLKAMTASPQRRLDTGTLHLVMANADRAIAQAKHDRLLPLGLRRAKNLWLAIREDVRRLEVDLAVVRASNQAVLGLIRQVTAFGGQAPSSSSTGSGATTPGSNAAAPPSGAGGTGSAGGGSSGTGVAQ